MFRTRTLFISLTLALVLSSCGGIPMPFDQTAAPKAGETIAVLDTNRGVIKMKFFAQYAPETVKNFTELAKKSFFDGLIFHRIIPGFMIQGGDPLGTGYGGETYKGPKTTLPGEVSGELHHVRGAVSMANSGSPNTASSQFFIVQNPQGSKFLDGGYTIFGQVFEGLETVDAIVNVARDANDRPKEKVIMNKVTIEEYEGPAAP